MKDEPCEFRTPDAKSPSKQRLNCIWDIDASQEEILLKSTSSSSIKRNKIRHSFCISPSHPKDIYLVDSSSYLVQNKNNNFNQILSSPLFARYNKIEMSGSRFLQSSPIPKIIKSPIRRTANAISIGSKSDLLNFGSSKKKTFIDKKLPTLTRSKINRIRTGRKSEETISDDFLDTVSIKHKDQAIAHILLKVSIEWASEFFFTNVLFPELKLAGIPIEFVPNEFTYPYKVVLFRHLNKYKDIEKAAIELNSSCQKCKDGSSCSLLEAGCLFLFFTPEELYNMRIEGLLTLLNETNGNRINSDPKISFCHIHQRINLVLIKPHAEVNGKKKKLSIVFPDPNDNTEKESINDIILELQLQKICQVLDWSVDSHSSLAAMITELIRTVAFEPFRIKQRGEPLTSSGRKGKDQKEIFKKILLMINGVSESTAFALVQKFSSLGQLISSLRKIEIEEGFLSASYSLSNISVQRPKSTKTIGDTLSQRIFNAFMGENPTIKIN